MPKIYNFLHHFILTFFSIIRIYLITRKNDDHNKFIMFYFPVKVYQGNIYDLTNLIKKKKKKYKVLLTYNSLSSKETNRNENSFFLDFNILKYIPFSSFFLKYIQVFLSSYLTYVFPPNSKNIYISHDIYDSPMTDKKNERNLFKKINELDYIFSSSNISKKFFLDKLKKYNKNIKPIVKNTGYLKLDNMYNLIKKENYFKKDIILIAPGFSNYFSNINIKRHLKDIIEEIILNLKMNVIYRPHPLDLNLKGDLEFTKKIYNTFSNNPKFLFDDSISYLNSFKKAKLMITDITSSAYTFSFSSNKPVIFFSPNDKKIKKDKQFKLNYFKDRIKIGVIIKNVKSIKKTINFLDRNKVNFKNKISKTRANRIENFKKSKQIMFLEINKIIKEL